jgi:hypothetical protein
VKNVTSSRSCNGGHKYESTGTRSKCSRCGSVQVDLTASRTDLAGDPHKTFIARRPTLFSLKVDKTEPAPEVGFGRARRRR